MNKCPLCHGTKKIKVDDYSKLLTRIKDCPVCVVIPIDNKDMRDILRKEA